MMLQTFIPMRDIYNLIMQGPDLAEPPTSELSVKEAIRAQAQATHLLHRKIPLAVSLKQSHT